ncbi:MAG: thioredoxin-like domain-containing protein [Cyclobacteriaceae bacterium]
MRLPLTILLTICAFSCLAQDGYNIQFKVSGLKDTTVYLGYFINESSFVKDTATVNSKGEFAFQGSKPLLAGVYMLVLNRAKQFEFLVADDQHFTLVTDRTDYVQNMKISGDRDNTLFFENIFFNIARNKEAEPFVKILQDSATKEDEKKGAREEMNKINAKVLAYQEDLIQKNGSTFTGRIIKSGKPVRIPDPPKRADGTIDSTFQLRWYREHFFDHFDLSDEALLRLPRPVYRDKIYQYLDKLYPPQADSLTKAIARIVAKAKKNPETYKYSVFLSVLKYQSHEIMGLDEVYVNLYDTYFASGEMDFWANANLKKNFKEQAERFRKSLIGKTGPNLIMQDVNLKPRALYDIKNKYSILYVFKPDCPSCKEETPKLLNFYNQKKFDVEVFAVCSDSSMRNMRDYIKELNLKWITVNGPRSYVGPYQDLYDAMSTPTLYVLDEKKKIIGKKIPSEKLEDFLTQYERIQKLRARL